MGMEKIDAAITGPLFDALAAMAATEDGRNQYYEYAYQRLVREGYDFGYVDITGLRFEEIDDEKDLLRAERMLAV
jgi:mannose/cellobiose epimerase-like protein (N-acyl-D-glucosamine 2-epimerase family)